MPQALKIALRSTVRQQRIGVTQLSLIIICILVLPASSTSTIGAPNKPQEGNDAAAYNVKGLELYGAGKYEDAVRSYKQAIKIKPDYPEAHYNLGDAFFQLKQYKKAIGAYKQAIRYNPGLSVAYDKMGTAHYKLGEHMKAISAYKEAIRRNPKSTLTYYNLGATYLDRDNEEGALEQYKILKTIDPRVAEKLYILIHKPMATVFDAGGVRLSVIATDSLGVPTNDLKQDDFQVFEDGVPQTISSFSKDQFSEVYGLAVDTSGSFAPSLEQAIEICKAIIQNKLPVDEALLVRFVDNDKIETVEDFTSDKEALNDGLDSLYVESGQSAILDAVYLSAQRVAQHKATNNPYLRRAVILVTDGDERASYYTVDDLLKLLHEIDVQVFVISLNKESRKDVKLNQNPPKGAIDLLTKLANETGGQAFFPKSVSELQNVPNQLMNMIRTQYLIGYKPKSAVSEAYRRVNVSILDKPGRDKQSALTRAGYVVSAK